MASLTGTKIKDTYQGLLKTSDNTTISTSLKKVSSGNGTESALSLSQSIVKVDALQIDSVTSGSTSTKVLTWDETTKDVEYRTLPVFESVTTTVAGDEQPTITIEDAGGNTATVTFSGSGGIGLLQENNTINLFPKSIDIAFIDSDTVLTGDLQESNVAYYVNPKALSRIVLPTAVAGLTYIFYVIDADSNNWEIATQNASDELFGKALVQSTAQDAMAIQNASQGDGYTSVVFNSSASHTGGNVGDVISCTAINDTSWFVRCCLSTQNTNPTSIATFVS